MFADEIAFVNFKNDWHKFNKIIETDLQYIHDDMKTNLLSLKINKSEFMPIVAMSANSFL